MVTYKPMIQCGMLPDHPVPRLMPSLRVDGIKYKDQRGLITITPWLSNVAHLCMTPKSVQSWISGKMITLLQIQRRAETKY